MRQRRNFLRIAVACTILALPQLVNAAQATPAIPPAITTPDKVQTRIGTLEFKDGAPTVETAEKVRDTLDFTRALNVYNNSFRGASADALGKGWFTILRLYSPLESFFTKQWRPSEIELVR